MIDMHTHLLPGVDDGPQTMQEAVVLCLACVFNGVKHAICTPHILDGRYNNTKTQLEVVFNALKAELANKNIPLKLSLSAEVRLDPTIFSLLDHKEIPLMNYNMEKSRSDVQGHSHILLEMPDGQIPLGAEYLIQQLLDLKITPIIAHPERNKQIMHDVGRIQPFLEMGCKMQITGASLIGQFGKSVESTAWKLIETGPVIAVASDCHNLKGRKPKMRQARKAIQLRYGKKIAKHLTHDGPSQLLK